MSKVATHSTTTACMEEVHCFVMHYERKLPVGRSDQIHIDSNGGEQQWPLIVAWKTSITKACYQNTCLKVYSLQQWV